MTTLEKPIMRKVEVGSLSLRHDPLIFTLHPSGFIGIREAGRRSQYKVDLKTVVGMAVRVTTNKITARVQELRREGMKLGAARRKATQECLQNLEK